MSTTKPPEVSESPVVDDEAELTVQHPRRKRELVLTLAVLAIAVAPMVTDERFGWSFVGKHLLAAHRRS